MNDDGIAPYHAHIYFVPETRAIAETLRLRLCESRESGQIARLLFVGQLRDRKVGPHPIPQFEIHFLGEGLPSVLSLIEASGLTALVHPLTDDDLADHTTLAYWIGDPLARPDHARSAGREPGHCALREIGFLILPTSKRQTRRRYSPVRVSISMLSPVETKSGTCTWNPFAIFAGFITLPDVSPLTAGSV